MTTTDRVEINPRVMLAMNRNGLSVTSQSNLRHWTFAAQTQTD